MWHLRNGIHDVIQSNESKTLFSKLVFVHLKDAHTTFRKVQLFVTVEMHNVSTRFENQELIVRITDECDPFFLYVLTLGEDDFHSLKSSQKLLVDFTSFPKMLVDRLELCLQEEYKETPKFLLQLGVQEMPGPGQAVLEVIQTDHYQQVALLSLKLVPATDAFVKKYLASCLKALKDDKENLTMKLKNVETELRERLRHSQELLQSKMQEIEMVRKDHSMQVEELKQLCNQEVRVELERKERELQEVKSNFEKERRDSEYSHNKSLQQLESKIAWLENQNRELQNKLYLSESSLRELQGRNSSIENEVQTLRQQLQAANKETGALEASCLEHEKAANHWQTAAKNLEQQVKEKDLSIARLEEQFNTLQNQKRTLDELNEQKDNILSRREMSLKALSDDVSKGNDIIRKLQAEVQSCRSKLKKSGTIAMQQEETVVELEKQLSKLQEERDSLKLILKEKEAEITKLSEGITEQKRKMEEFEQKIKTDNEVMAYLHKQLNESRGVPRFSPTSANSYPRSTYLNQNTSPVAVGNYAYAGFPFHQQRSLALSNKGGSPVVNEDERRAALAPVSGLPQPPPASVTDNFPLDPKYFERNPSKTVQTTSSDNYLTTSKAPTSAAGGQPVLQKSSETRSASAAIDVQSAGDGRFHQPVSSKTQTKQSPVPFVPVTNRPRTGAPSAYFPTRPMQT